MPPFIPVKYSHCCLFWSHFQLLLLDSVLLGKLISYLLKFELDSQPNLSSGLCHSKATYEVKIICGLVSFLTYWLQKRVQ